MSLFITCSHCDNEFTVDDNMYGETVACPHCEQQIIVETEEELVEDRPRLQIKRDTLISDAGKACPACGGTIAEESVVCVLCGFDMRTGGTHTTSHSSATLKKLLILLLVAVVGVVLAKLFMGGKNEDWARPPVQIPAPEQPAPAVEEPLPPEEPPAEVAEVEETVVEEEPAVEVDEVDWVNLEQRLRERVRATMEAKQPLFRPGEVVRLRRASGIIQSGKLMRTTNTEAIILQDDREVAIPLTELDRATRLRADRDYRERYAQYQAQVMIKKRQQQLAEGASEQAEDSPEDAPAAD